MLRAPRFFALCVPLAFGLTLSACGPSESAAESDPAPSGSQTLSGPVLASTWPLASLAEALFGTQQAVRCLVPPGEDPAFWQPEASDLEAVLTTPWLLLNGADFEAWASTANLPLSRTLQTGQAFRSAWIENESGSVHSHGAAGAHSHKGYDPHYWMDPLLALEQARAMQAGAIAADLIDASSLSENLAALDLRLRELDALWTQIAEQLGSQTVLANHGTYTYPGQRYGIVFEVIDQDPGEDLSAEAREALAARTAGAKYMLFEASPTPLLARTLKEEFQIEGLVLRPAEAPIAGYASALDVWREDLTALLARLKNES